MGDYWNKRFTEEGMIWGCEPSQTVLEFTTSQRYDGIYCYDLLHLFLLEDRKKLIQNCVKHLKELGVMYFTCFSNCDFNNGVGREIEEGTYEYKKGKYAHFFTEEDLKEHFNDLNILETGSIRETLIYAEKQQKKYELRYIFVQKMG